MARAHKFALGVLLAGSALLTPALLAQDTAQAPQGTAQAQGTAQGPRHAAVPAAATHHKLHKVQKVQKPVVLPPMPAGPLSQLPMDQIPATPAKVTFQGGLLSISAQNSSLGEILRAVRQLTGAEIEIPPGSAANERVVTNLGPGVPRDVLAGLLNGSSFDYVMLGSISDPTAVSSVILTAKSSSAGETQTASAAAYQNSPDTTAPRVWPPMAPGAKPGPPNPMFNRVQGAPQPGNTQTAEDDSKDEDQDTADDSDDPAQPGQPDMNGGNPSAAQDQPQLADPNQPNAGPKTPEQILDMLRRQQPPGGPITSPPPPQPQP